MKKILLILAIILLGILGFGCSENSINNQHNVANYDTLIIGDYHFNDGGGYVGSLYFEVDNNRYRERLDSLFWLSYNTQTGDTTWWMPYYSLIKTGTYEILNDRLILHYSIEKRILLENKWEYKTISLGPGSDEKIMKFKNDSVLILTDNKNRIRIWNKIKH